MSIRQVGILNIFSVRDALLDALGTGGGLAGWPRRLATS